MTEEQKQWQAELIRRFSEGLPFRRDLRRMVRNILRDDDLTQDVLQEVHTAAWLHVSTGGEIDDLRRYLTRMARNRAIDVKRQRRREVPLDEEAMEQPALPEVPVTSVLDRLPPDVRKKVELVLAHGFKGAADQLGVSESALYKAMKGVTELILEEPHAERNSD